MRFLLAIAILATTASCSGKYSYEWEYNFFHGKKKNQELACVQMNPGGDTYTVDNSGCVRRYAPDVMVHDDTGGMKNI